MISVYYDGSVVTMPNASYETIGILFNSTKISCCDGCIQQLLKSFFAVMEKQFTITDVC
jgi:hypothetical protein